MKSRNKMLVLTGKSHSLFSSYLTWDTRDIPLRVLGFRSFDCLKVRKSFKCVEVVDGVLQCQLLYLESFIKQGIFANSSKIQINDLTVRDFRARSDTPIIEVFDSHLIVKFASIMTFCQGIPAFKLEGSSVNLFEKGVRVPKKCPAFLLVDGFNLENSNLGSRANPLCKEQTGLGTIRLKHDGNVGGKLCEVFVKEPLPLLELDEGYVVTVVS